jgi:hypothetical protein
MPDLTLDIIQSLVPPTDAPERLPAGVSPDLVSARRRSLNIEQQRIYRWLTFLQAVAESQRFDRDYPGFQYFTFGFIPLGRRADNVPYRGGYTFGIALELEEGESGPDQEVLPITDGDVVHPLVINRRKAKLDVIDPTNPPGTGACWAKSRKKAITPAADGVLTAEHVVSGRALQSSVSMSDGKTWHLGDRGSCKLDAALIVQAGCIPQNATTLNVQSTPVPPAQISFHGSATGHVITASITHAMIHSTYLNHANPMRVFFDKHGIGGDSGALVKETGSGLGVGIYMGVAPVPGTTGEGIAQALSQAQDSLQLDLFII